jgi:hypothetical protein
MRIPMGRVAPIAVMVAVAGPVVWGTAQAASPTTPALRATPPRPGGELVRHVTQGRAKTVIDNLLKCTGKIANHRISAVGTITATDGTVLTVPAATAYQTAPKAADLHNECNQVAPKRAADVSTDKVPVVEIDKDGEIVTGFIVVDNYFELYVNGKLIAVDAVPFTPMNSSIVKFRVKRPYTLAFKLVDWEENLGIGTEVGGTGGPWHPGDGGLIARFSDGTVTDGSWKAQSFYIAPLMSPDDVSEKAGLHVTAGRMGRVHPYVPKPPCEDRCYAVHYPIPKSWADPKFDDSNWPRAFEYTDEEVGVTNLRAYTQYPELFAGARWIWSFNLVFDNLVFARKTVK